MSITGTVQSYNSDAQTVDVVPDPTDYPLLADVPVAFHRGGDGFLSVPVQPGDRVVVLFMDRTWDDDVDLRSHSLSDGIAIPWSTPIAASAKATDGVTIGVQAGKYIDVTRTEVRLGSHSPADYVALASKVDDQVSRLDGRIDAIISAFNAHIHPVPLPTPMSPTPSLIPDKPIINFAISSPTGSSSVKCE